MIAFGARRWIQYLAADSLTDYLMNPRQGHVFDGASEAAEEAIAERTLVAQQVVDSKLNALILLGLVYGLMLMGVLMMAYMWRSSSDLTST